MKEATRKSFITTACLCAATLIYTIFTAVIDRKAIGPNGTKVGFSHLNGSFSEAIGYNPIWDKITDVTMVIAILVAVSFVALGVMQLVKRKNVFKVDKCILAMAALYIIVVILYIFFDKVAINYRPILMEGETEPEASFPSTHVLVICTILGAALIAWKRLLGQVETFIGIESKKLFSILRIAVVIVMAIAVGGRLIAGVHWMTDIFAGCLFSAALISLYVSVLPLFKLDRK